MTFIVIPRVDRTDYVPLCSVVSISLGKDGSVTIRYVDGTTELLDPNASESVSAVLKNIQSEF